FVKILTKNVDSRLVGIQIKPIRWNCLTFLSMASNLFINIFIMYAVFGISLNFLEEEIVIYSKIINHKPLLGLILRTDFFYIYPLSIIANQVYFNTVGRRMG